jgi:hypothetical protein
MLLLVDLRLLHVVVGQQLLLLLWSSKESDLANGNCTCCTVDEDIVALQKYWQTFYLSLSLSLVAIQEHQNPDTIPSAASEVDPNAISLPPRQRTLD